MLLEHERNYGLGMDVLVTACSWNTPRHGVGAAIIRLSACAERYDVLSPPPDHASENRRGFMRPTRCMSYKNLYKISVSSTAANAGVSKN